MVNETNFDALKDILQEVACINSTTGGQNSSFNPNGKKAAEIAAKLLKGRARAAKDKGYSVDGTLTRYVSILTIGLHSMSLQDLLNCTVYQLYDLIVSYRVHGKGTEKYDNVRIGMNSRLDTLQAGILLPKLEAFEEYELNISKKSLCTIFRTDI